MGGVTTVGVFVLVFAVVLNLISRRSIRDYLTAYLVAIGFIIIGLLVGYKPELGKQTNSESTYLEELTSKDKRIREHINDFVEKGIFTEFIKNNNGNVMQYGYIQDGEVPNAFIIQIQFPQAQTLPQIKNMVMEFANKKHSYWSIAYDWRKIQKDLYSISYYESGFDIIVNYAFSPKYPNKFAISVNSYQAAMEFENSNK